MKFYSNTTVLIHLVGQFIEVLLVLFLFLQHTMVQRANGRITSFLSTPVRALRAYEDLHHRDPTQLSLKRSEQYFLFVEPGNYEHALSISPKLVHGMQQSLVKSSGVNIEKNLLLVTTTPKRSIYTNFKNDKNKNHTSKYKNTCRHLRNPDQIQRCENDYKKHSAIDTGSLEDGSIFTASKIDNFRYPVVVKANLRHVVRNARAGGGQINFVPSAAEMDSPFKPSSFFNGDRSSTPSEHSPLFENIPTTNDLFHTSLPQADSEEDRSDFDELYPTLYFPNYVTHDTYSATSDEVDKRQANPNFIDHTPIRDLKWHVPYYLQRDPVSQSLKNPKLTFSREIFSHHGGSSFERNSKINYPISSFQSSKRNPHLEQPKSHQSFYMKLGNSIVGYNIAHYDGYYTYTTLK